MAINLKSTKDVGADGIKVLVYGHSGSGKTTLIRTLESPVILSAESGLLSLSGSDIPFIEIKGMEDLQDAYAWALESEESKQFGTICLDSISEIGEVVLMSEKKKSKDPRQAYGEMQTTLGELIRCFRDLPGRNVYFSAKCEKVQDEHGRLLYGPSMPGNKMAQSLPYFFDMVHALRVEKNEEGEIERALQTDSDGIWTAKSRTNDSNRLDMWEPADLGHIFKKLRGKK